MSQDADEAPPPGWEGVLEPGERLLWQGRPDASIGWEPPKGRDLRGGIAISAFAVIWMVAVAMTGSIVWLFGLLFLGLGLSRLFGQHHMRARRLRGTTYSLTTRRAIIATDHGGKRDMISYPIDATTPVASDGAEPATITFATRFGPGGPKPIGFERVARGAELFAMFRAVQQGRA